MRRNNVPIGHVTNGVHTDTWLAPEIRPLYDKYIKSNWSNVDRIPPADLWGIRRMLRQRMIHFVRQKLADQVVRQNGPAEDLHTAWSTLDPDTLTIGFARRFATYKRTPLIFRDARRLARILNNEKHPVQLVFAGKRTRRTSAARSLPGRFTVTRAPRGSKGAW